MGVRSLQDIKTDIDAASERRAELWHALGRGRDPETVAELQQLEERLARLWDEHREVRARIRFGEREKILARARTEERLARAA